MFRDWSEFFVITGSASGGLIGVMFIVATLAAGFQASDRSKRGLQVYLTPIVFNFALVMVVSAVTAVPGLPPIASGMALAACAFVGFVHSLRMTVRIFDGEFSRRADAAVKLFYGYFPALAYLALCVAAGMTLFAEERAPYAAGAAVLALLLIGIRNAWDLAIFLVQRRPDPHG